MEWRNRRSSDNVEDVGSSSEIENRGGGGRTITGTLATMVIAFVLWKAFGVNPNTTMQIANAVTGAEQSSTYSTTQNKQNTQNSQRTGQDLTDKQFISVVLADTEDTWSVLFQRYGKTYQAPVLTLFSGQTQTRCGMADAGTGPFYCPADQHVYLDTHFFTQMRTQLAVGGDQSQQTDSANNEAGDFAQAYVVAHEVGHHVQNLLGIATKVQQARAQASEVQSNQLSVRLELQADCFAGVWANHTQQRVHFLQAGDLEEAIDAASQIGDDRIQQRGRGYVTPESFTHGSSQQRVQWFTQGFKSGDILQCDTFK